MAKFTFRIMTLGCRVNQYESEYLRNRWLALGGEEAAGEADIVCVNSCAVTAHAERESRNALYRAARKHPRAKIVLTGCAASLIPRAVLDGEGGFPPHAAFDAIIDKTALLDYPCPPGRSPGGFFPPAPAARSRFSRPVVKIQDGCDAFCAYCIVPHARSGVMSRNPQAIAEEMLNLIAEGHGEIVLSGINLRLFRHGEIADLWELIDYLETILDAKAVSGFRIRLSSLNPAMFGEKAYQTIRRSRFLVPHVHLSVQHASGAVLRRMGRRDYDAAQVLQIAERLKEIWGVFGLGADFIAGFPGESEEDFREMLDLMGRLPLSYAHVFPFSARPGAPAAAFSGQLAKAVKMERAAAARRIAEKARAEFLQRQFNLASVAVVPEKGRGQTGKGMNEFYVPCYYENSPERDKSLFRGVPKRLFEDGVWIE